MSYFFEMDLMTGLQSSSQATAAAVSVNSARVMPRIFRSVNFKFVSSVTLTDLGIWRSLGLWICWAKSPRACFRVGIVFFLPGLTTHPAKGLG